MTIDHDLTESIIRSDDGDPKIKMSIVVMIIMGFIAAGVIFMSVWVSKISSTQDIDSARLSVVETNQRMVISTLPELRTSVEDLKDSVMNLTVQLAVHQAATERSDRLNDGRRGPQGLRGRQGNQGDAGPIGPRGYKGTDR
jgi:hypothetical protein